MNSGGKFKYKSNGNLAEVIEGGVFAGSKAVSEYFLEMNESNEGGNWLPSDVVFIIFKRPDGAVGSPQIMDHHPDGYWHITTNGWETNVDIGDTVSKLDISFSRRRYSTVSASRFSSTQPTEIVSIPFYPSNEFIPLEIDDNESNAIFEAIGNLQSDFVEVNATIGDMSSKISEIEENGNAALVSVNLAIDNMNQEIASTKAYVDEETARSIAAELELQTRIAAQEGLGGALTAYNFGTAKPTQIELETYALSQIQSISNPRDIWNGTHVTNLYDGSVWQLNNTVNTEPPIYEWVNIGSSTVSQATNETLGLSKGSEMIPINSRGEYYTTTYLIGAAPKMHNSSTKDYGSASMETYGHIRQSMNNITSSIESDNAGLFAHVYYRHAVINNEPIFLALCVGVGLITISGTDPNGYLTMILDRPVDMPQTSILYLSNDQGLSKEYFKQELSIHGSTAKWVRFKNGTTDWVTNDATDFNGWQRVDAGNVEALLARI